MVFALRLLHIVLGAFWVGAIVFSAFFLMPAVRAAGPGGGGVMAQIMGRLHFHTYMLSAVWLTILSGLAMGYHNGGESGFRWFAIGVGRMFGLGGVLAIIAGILGGAVTAPAAQKLGALSAKVQASGAPPTPADKAELERLQSRLFNATRLVAVLVLLAVAAMAVARYSA